MGEDAPSAQLAVREINETRQSGSAGATETDTLAHARHPVTLTCGESVADDRAVPGDDVEHPRAGAAQQTGGEERSDANDVAQLVPSGRAVRSSSRRWR